MPPPTVAPTAHVPHTADQRYIEFATEKGQSWDRVPAPDQSGPRDGVARVRSERIDITPGLGEGLSGYSIDIPARRARGWLGNLYALVVLTDDGAGQRHALLSFDLHIGSRWVAERVARLTAATVGTSIDRIFLSAAHTHAGPGGLYGSRFYDFGTCSVDVEAGFNRTYLEALCQRIARSLGELARQIDAAPPGESTLEYRESVVWGVCWQRALGAHLANYGDIAAMSDATVRALAARTALTFARALPTDADLPSTDPRYLAVDSRVRCLAWDLAGPAPTVIAFVNVTPTRLGGEAMILGADVFGMAARWVEARLSPGARVAVAGGAHGDGFILDPELSLEDVRRDRESIGHWTGVHLSLASAARQAERLGRAILVALGRGEDGTAPSQSISLAPAPRSIRLDESTLAGASRAAAHASIADRMSVGVGMLKGNDLEAPSTVLNFILDGLKGAAKPYPPEGTAWPREYRFGWAHESADEHDPQWPKAACGPVDVLETESAGAMTPWVTSRIATFVRTDGQPGLRLVGVPFEPTTMAAHEIEELLAAPGEQVMVACLAGDYLGYLTTSAEYRVQEYEGGSTWFGRGTHNWVKAQLARLAGIAHPPDPDFPLVVRSRAWFGTGADMVMFPDSKQEPLHKRDVPAAGIAQSPAVAPAMPQWLRLEGNWAASDRRPANGSPSALDPSLPDVVRPWVRLLVGDAPGGPFSAGVLDGGASADDQCGWMILRREEGIDPPQNLPYRVVWRWSLCAPFPHGWRGKWVTFDVSSTHAGVQMVNGPVPPVRLPG